MKYIFIINSLAGRGNYKKILPNIKKACDERNLEYEIRFITEKITGAEIAKEYQFEENIIYVVGGDRNIN